METITWDEFASNDFTGKGIYLEEYKGPLTCGTIKRYTVNDDTIDIEVENAQRWDDPDDGIEDIEPFTCTLSYKKSERFRADGGRIYFRDNPTKDYIYVYINTKSNRC